MTRAPHRTRPTAPMLPLLATSVLLGLLLSAGGIRVSSYQPTPPVAPRRSQSWSRASHALFPRSGPGSGSGSSVVGPSAQHPPPAAANVVVASASSAAIGLSVDVPPRKDSDEAVVASAKKELGPLAAQLTKVGMILYILGMCVALPLTLAPLSLLERIKVIDRLQREQMSLRTGCFCSRWLMRLIPFANVKVVGYQEDEPKPSVWVCNHTSMLDVFVLLAVDKKLRGKNRRPIKIVYWKGLEDNPVTKLLFRMCGMIAVDMADNGNGNANEYNKASFKPLLKSIKQAFEEGFDVGILPEGQLNPTPEKGLLPVFAGAYTLAKMSRRRIQMMALNGVERLWHPDESVGMSPTARDVTVRAYPPAKPFESGDEFALVFRTVVGHFGATGRDIPNLERWLDGTNWSALQRKLKEEEEEEKA